MKPRLTVPAPQPRRERFLIDTDEWEPDFPRGAELLVDPDRTKTDGCFVVLRIKGLEDPTRLSRWKPTGRDSNRRFLPKGHPDEAFHLVDAEFHYTAPDEERGMVLEILGVVVGWLMPMDGGQQKVAS